MPEDRSSERTKVVATYSTRRDAEMAQSRLEDENIQAFITADDAGGMHPQLQWTHGVKLSVLDGAEQDARRTLKEGELLPETGNASGEGAGQEEQAEDVVSFRKMSQLTAIAVIATLLLVVLLFLLGELV